MPDIKMSEIPDYGEHMLLDEWLACCESGGFIDYDGSGNLATKSEMSNCEVYPSTRNEIDRSRWTHIVWFNK